VELSTSHDEGIVSWYHSLLAEGAQVHIASSTELFARTNLVGVPFASVNVTGSWLSRMMSLRKLYRYIRKNEIGHVVINTASGTLVRDFLWFLPKQISVVGVLHHIGRINSSWTQKQITQRLKAYAIISPHLLEGMKTSSIPVHVVPLTAVPNSKRESESEFESKSESESQIALVEIVDEKNIKPAKEFWVVIPGNIEGLRKDYYSLLNPKFMQQLPTNVKFVFLGDASGHRPDRVTFKRHAIKYAKQCIWFDNYISHELFHQYMRQADVVLPLIHPNCHEYSEFMSIKSSGAFTMAWTYKKPMLLERGFSVFPHLHFGSKFYDVPELPKILRQLAIGELTIGGGEVPWNDKFRQDSTVQIITNSGSPLTKNF